METTYRVIDVPGLEAVAATVTPCEVRSASGELIATFDLIGLPGRMEYRGTVYERRGTIEGGGRELYQPLVTEQR